jgi:hypothetical protein
MDINVIVIVFHMKCAFLYFVCLGKVVIDIKVCDPNFLSTWLWSR